MRKKREPQRLVVEMQRLMHHHEITRKEVTEKAGLGRNSIGQWVNNGVKPTIESFDMALNAMGYKLEIVGNNETEK